MSENYKIGDIFDLIKSQLNDIMNNSIDYYSKFTFVLENEQVYVNPKDRKEPNKIYIVLKVLPSNISFGVSSVPITLTAVSEQNHIEACQRLLTEYAQAYNFVKGKTIENLYYNQNYKAPASMSSFTEMFTGYRNTFILSGTLILSYNAIHTKYIYYNHYNLYGEEQNYSIKNTSDYIDLDIVTKNESTVFSMDTQPYSDNYNFSESSPKFAAGSMTFWIYLTNNDFCKKVLKLKHKKKSVMENYFAFGIKYYIDDDSDFDETFVELYRLHSVVINDNAGEIPSLNVSFTY